MKRFYPILTVVALFLLLLELRASAAPIPRQYVPIIANAYQGAQLVKLIDHDTGFVNAVASSDGRIFVAYQSRPDGTVYLTEDVGDRLKPITVPPVGLAPQASDLPGPKQGSVSQVIIGQTLYVYYTGRAEGDPTGPFFVWRLTMPLPTVQP